MRRQWTWQDRITLHFWVQPPNPPRGTSKPGTDGYIANYPLEQRMSISLGAEDSLGVETRGLSTHDMSVQTSKKILVERKNLEKRKKEKRKKEVYFS